MLSQLIKQLNTMRTLDEQTTWYRFQTYKILNLGINFMWLSFQLEVNEAEWSFVESFESFQMKTLKAKIVTKVLRNPILKLSMKSSDISLRIDWKPIENFRLKAPKVYSRQTRDEFETIRELSLESAWKLVWKFIGELSVESSESSCKSFFLTALKVHLSSI